MSIYGAYEWAPEASRPNDWGWLIGADPYSQSMQAARSFYQPWVVEQFLAQEKHDRMKREIVGSGQFVDDVAGQLHT